MECRQLLDEHLVGVRRIFLKTRARRYSTVLLPLMTGESKSNNQSFILNVVNAEQIYNYHGSQEGSRTPYFFDPVVTAITEYRKLRPWCRPLARETRAGDLRNSECCRSGAMSLGHPDPFRSSSHMALVQVAAAD